MANRFHIVPGLGEARPCSAKDVSSCKYAMSGEDVIHGESVAEVQKIYENEMKAQTFSSPSDSSDADEIKYESVYDRTHFRIPEEKYEKAVKKIDSANKRLTKLGIDERFDMQVEKTFEEKTRTDPETGIKSKYAEVFYNIELSEPKLSYDGYEFQAVMNAEGKGFIVRSSPEVELGGERPDSMYCEHCGHNRRRAKTYLIKGPDGETKQIGSRCVEAYLGVRPDGLWALEYDFEDQIGGTGGDGSGKRHDSVDETLAMALVVSESGDNYVSSSYGDSTSDEVYDIRFGGHGVDANWRSEMWGKVIEMRDNGKEVKKLKKKIMDAEPNNDYIRNLQAAVSDDYASVSSQNIIVSSVSILKREERMRKIEEEKEKRRKMKEEMFKPGHLGQPEDKLKNMSYELMDVKSFESYDYYGNSVTKYVTTMRDDEGRKLTYFASEDITDRKDENGKVSFTSGRISKHDSYDGQDQTVMSYMRMKKKKVQEEVKTDSYGNRLMDDE